MCIHVWFHIRWIGKRRYRERYFSRRIFSAFDVDNDNVLGLYIKNKYLTASIQFNVLSQNQHQALAVQKNICHIGQKYDEKTNKVFCSVCMQAYKHLQIKCPITGFSDDVRRSLSAVSIILRKESRDSTITRNAMFIDTLLHQYILQSKRVFWVWYRLNLAKQEKMRGFVWQKISKSSGFSRSKVCLSEDIMSKTQISFNFCIYVPVVCSCTVPKLLWMPFYDFRNFV